MRIQNSERIAKLLAEISHLKWDIICVSETRAVSQQMDFPDGHRFITYRESYAATGIGIFIHSRLVHCIIKLHMFSDRILQIDLRIGQHMYAIFSVYGSHAGFLDVDLDNWYTALFGSLAECV